MVNKASRRPPSYFSFSSSLKSAFFKKTNTTTLKLKRSRVVVFKEARCSKLMKKKQTENPSMCADLMHLFVQDPSLGTVPGSAKQDSHRQRVASHAGRESQLLKSTK